MDERCWWIVFHVVHRQLVFGMRTIRFTRCLLIVSPWVCSTVFLSPQNLKAWTDGGDIIGAKGSMKRTEKGELSVYVKSWSMLSKSLLPLPDKFHGLTDTEKRYRLVRCGLIYSAFGHSINNAMCAQPVLKHFFQIACALRTRDRCFLLLTIVLGL